MFSNICCFAYPRLITALHHQWELSNWFPKALQLALGFVKLCSDNSNTPIQLCILTIQHLHHPLHIALGIVCQLQLFLSLLQLCLELLALCSLRIIRSLESLALAVPLLVLCMLEGSWLCPPTTFLLQTFDFSFQFVDPSTMASWDDRCQSYRHIKWQLWQQQLHCSSVCAQTEGSRKKQTVETQQSFGFALERQQPSHSPGILPPLSNIQQVTTMTNIFFTNKQGCNKLTSQGFRKDPGAFVWFAQPEGQCQLCFRTF